VVPIGLNWTADATRAVTLRVTAPDGRRADLQRFDGVD
jgi:hypothetical protein